MTVAAIVIAPSPDVALTEIEGLPLIRRVVDAAWSGGALPLVVVVPDPAGDVAGVLDGTPALVVSPGPDDPRGIAWFVAGMEAAMMAVTATRAGLLWPARFAWLDPETVTSLIEAHGVSGPAIVQASYGGTPGFPALVPAAYLERAGALRGASAEEALAALEADGIAFRLLALGDPGIVHDVATPRAALPRFEAPPEPAAGPPPEWGAGEAPLAADE